MNKPHLHAEVIIAWANGAEIEYSNAHYPSEWREIENGTPSWSEHFQYRVKPKTVVKYHGIMQGTDGYEEMNHTTGYYDEANSVCSNDNKWEVIAIVKTTFVDNFPVSVEII